MKWVNPENLCLLSYCMWAFMKLKVTVTDFFSIPEEIKKKEKDNDGTKDWVRDDLITRSKGGPIKKSCLRNVGQVSTKRKGGEISIGMCSLFRLFKKES